MISDVLKAGDLGRSKSQMKGVLCLTIFLGALFVDARIGRRLAFKNLNLPPAVHSNQNGFPPPKQHFHSVEEPDYPPVANLNHDGLLPPKQYFNPVSDSNHHPVANLNHNGFPPRMAHSYPMIPLYTSHYAPQHTRGSTPRYIPHGHHIPHPSYEPDIYYQPQQHSQGPLPFLS